MLLYLNDRRQADSLDRAIRIAVAAHRDQVDRGGMPYITHPIRLMMQMDTPEAMQVAILHDVVEDSDYTLEDLRSEGFSEAVVRAVDALTRVYGEPYEDNLQRIRQNPLALMVKLKDLQDNMNTLRLATFDDTQLERLQKYHRAYHYLSDESDKPKR